MGKVLVASIILLSCYVFYKMNIWIKKHLNKNKYKYIDYSPENF